jgi:hypothetical protein
LSKRDIAASVRQRLLNQSRAQNRPFQELLQYYAMERFLYRLAQSGHTDKFVLKGALLLTAWRAPISRQTVDIDLLGKTSNELEHIISIVSEICALEPGADGVRFDRASVKATRIKEDADYEGVRVQFKAILAGARIPSRLTSALATSSSPKPHGLSTPHYWNFLPLSSRHIRRRR